MIEKKELKGFIEKAINMHNFFGELKEHAKYPNGKDLEALIKQESEKIKGYYKDSEDLYSFLEYLVEELNEVKKAFATIDELKEF
jgi:hypothetical protein